MKYLFALFLAIGVVAAYPLADQDEALANSDVSFINFQSSADQSRYVERLQEALKRTVEALKEKLDQGHEHGTALILRAHKLSERLRQMHADMGEKLRKAIESYHGKAKEFVESLKQYFNQMRKTTESPDVVRSSAYLEEEDEALANIDLSYVNFASRDEQDKFVERLQEALKRTVESVKQALEEGEKMGQELIVRAHKLAEKLRMLGADMGQQVRQAISTFRGVAREFAQKLREFFRRSQRPTAAPRVRRSPGQGIDEQVDEALANSDVNFINFASNEDRNRFVARLQEALKRTVEALKEKLDKGHDQGTALILRAHKLSEKLQQLHADMGDKLRQAIESYQGQAQEFAKKLAEFFNRPTSTTEATM